MNSVIKRCALGLALAAAWPLGAQTGSSCIAPGNVWGELMVIGLPFSLQFVINPGWLTGPTTGLELNSASNLPPGLTFNASTGVLSGTPTALGQYMIVLRVDTVPASKLGCQINYPLIVQSPLSAAPSQLPPGNLGAGYMAPVTLNGGLPLTFTLTGGNLPPGITFDSTTYFALAGTPTAQGTYTFSGTSSDAEGESVTGQYTVTIGPQGNVSVTPASLAFNGVAGGAARSFPIDVVSSDLTAVPFTASAASPWISISPTSGTTPARVMVQVTPGSMAAGNYTGTIQVSPRGQGTITSNVSLQLLASITKFQVVPAGVNVAYAPGANLNQTVTTMVQVINGTNTQASGTVTPRPPAAGPQWLSVTPAQFTLPVGGVQTLAVTADGSKVYTGSHLGQLQIKGLNQEIDVPVTLTVPQATVPQTVNVSATGYWETACSGSGGIVEHNIYMGTVNVPTPGTDTNWTASLSGFPGGVTFQPAQGNASTFFTVYADPCLLGQGSHYGYLKVTAPNMTPSTAYQKWTICIDPPAMNGCTNLQSGPDVDSDDLVMVAPPDYGPISTQITVTGSDSRPLQFSVNVGADAPPGVIVTPARGVATSTPTTVTVTADPSKFSATPAAGDLVDVSADVGYPFAVPKGLAGVFMNPTAGPVTTAHAAAHGGAQPHATTCTPSKILVVPTSPASLASQLLDVPTTIKARLLDDCGNAITDASVSASFSTGEAGVGLTLSDATRGIYSGTWRPAKAAASATLTLLAVRGSMPTATAATYVTVRDDPGAPIVAANGVLNNLNPMPGAPIAPGTLAAVWGTNLAAGTEQAGAVPLPTQLAGTQVLIGGIAAPLFYASPNQIDVQIPTELPPNTTQQVMVVTNGNVTVPQTIQLSPVTPGIAVYGNNDAIAQHAADYTLVTASSPAHPNEWVIVYLVGMGATSPAVATNQQSPSTTPLAQASVQPTVTLDGTAVNIGYAGLSPGWIGLYQINFQVPSSARTGDLPLVIIQNDTAANTATLPVGN
jgi:uncharacterized protein (TIGR03437 family)